MRKKGETECKGRCIKRGGKERTRSEKEERKNARAKKKDPNGKDSLKEGARQEMENAKTHNGRNG